jgi:outer membrane cobalamin receptor
MRQVFIIVLLTFTFSYTSFSQKATIQGTVKDAGTGELLQGATVLQPPANGVTTDIGGTFQLQTDPGEVTLIVSYIGMKQDTVHFNVKPGQTKTRDFTLGGNDNELVTIVVTENKVGEKIQKVTQSVDVIKPRMLENNNITNMEQAVTKLPGVTVLDGQMSVRGGSGYAYGAGSRVTLVVDEIPLMTADRQDIKWPFVPIENVEQIELVKGAASVQYGSSALNGVMNVTTAYARDTPITKIMLYYTGTGKPPVDSFQWWKRDGKFFQNPNDIGMDFLHSQKFGDFDLVVSGMMKGQQSYLQSDEEQYTRFSGKLRWHPHKFQRFTFELESSALYDVNSFQFYWLNAQHPYISAPGVVTMERYAYAYIDPKFKLIDKKGNEHKLFYRVYRQVLEQGVSAFWINALYYQFRHDFGQYFRLLAGANNEHYKMADGNLGVHHGDYGGAFISGQLTYKFLTLNAGAREEYVHEDSVVYPTLPIFRAGASFEIRKYNYLRISFGQAFRVPSIAERYVDYSLGSINIVPNTSLQPERGYSAEIGYKRSIKIGNWLGYFDATAFLTHFNDMIEFVFDLSYNSHGLYPYFQSQNISKAQIFGWELSWYGEGYIAPNVEMTTQFGYTYFYGVNLDDTADAYNKNFGTFLKNAFTHFTLKTYVDDYSWNNETAGMLKYRNPQQFKADVDFIFFKKYHAGTSLQYYGYMTQVDPIFAVFIPGVDEYRMQTRNKGQATWDLRTGYEFNKNLQLNFLVKNVLNSYTIFRVARPDAPRTFTVQLMVNFGRGLKKRAAIPQGSNM